MAGPRARPRAGSFAIAVAIAAVVILAAVLVWPGYALVRGRDLAGYWASSDGAFYEVRDAGGRAFTVRAAGEAPVAGAATGLRGVVVDSVPKKVGRLEVGGLRIEWKGGARSNSWFSQGVA